MRASACWRVPVLTRRHSWISGACRRHAVSIHCFLALAIHGLLVQSCGTQKPVRPSGHHDQTVLLLVRHYSGTTAVAQQMSSRPSLKHLSAPSGSLSPRVSGYPGCCCSRAFPFDYSLEP
eukprot:14640471-Alexandrium_andersonii.AAC.1